MKVIKTLSIVLLVILAIVIGGLYATGNGGLLGFGWAVLTGGPDQPFDPADAAPAPDYTDSNNWAALPTREGPEDFVPAGVNVAVTQGNAPVDVFFVHPTGYLRGSTWTWSMDPNTATEENTQWMLANQASAFNGCCNIYAPRYRQANILAYFKGDALREKVLGFAYEDVARAFAHFIDQFNDGRPFILASHSQGTHHGVRLLREVIDGTPLAERMVAAYLIGGSLSATEFSGLQDVTICADATQLHCAVHWDTWSEAVIEDTPADAGNVCVNPLSWRQDEMLADASQHAGAVPVSGQFQVGLDGPDTRTGIIFEPLGAPLPNMLQAQCKSGGLFISDQSKTSFGSTGGSFGGGNYHGLDYPVFHMDIRNNAMARVSNYYHTRGRQNGQ